MLCFFCCSSSCGRQGSRKGLKANAGWRFIGHHVLIRLSFFGAPLFLRANCLAVDENGAIRVVAGEVGLDWGFSFLDHAQVLHAEERMVVRVRALLGSWKARANEAMMGDEERCIFRRLEEDQRMRKLKGCRWRCFAFFGFTFNHRD
jgi:hypothetical protein